MMALKSTRSSPSTACVHTFFHSRGGSQYKCGVSWKVGFKIIRPQLILSMLPNKDSFLRDFDRTDDKRDWRDSDISKFGGMRIYNRCEAWCLVDARQLPLHLNSSSTQLELLTGRPFTCKHTHTHLLTQTVQVLPDKTPTYLKMWYWSPRRKWKSLI